MADGLKARVLMGDMFSFIKYYVGERDKARRSSSEREWASDRILNQILHTAASPHMEERSKFFLDR